MDKQKVLANVTNLTAEQLFDEINKDTVTLEELKSTDNLDITKRKKIEDLQKQADLKEKEAWERARYGNEMILSDYISNFPTGKHVQEAKDKIQYLEQERRRTQAAKQEILDNLKRNSNSLTPYQINNHLNNNTISEADLIECGFPKYIIEVIKGNINPPYLELGVTPNSIPEGYTEVYFWGIPGSGKTCALAAILSTAEKMGYLEIAIGPGFDYMTRLKNIFVDDNAILPPPTNVEETQYLPFTLKKTNEKFARSVSLVELSGEIFQCFLKKNANKQLFDQHERTFNTLMNFLKGKNRKIHFFFIDFDKENRKDDDGYIQSDYLNSAATFFKNHDIFSKTTDAIYLVLTKSDLMPCKKEERTAFAKEHLQKHNFTAFINALKARCKQHSINAGKLTVEPFSLGRVYAKQICNFDNSAAIKFIDILIDRIEPSKKSILDVFNK